MSYYIGLMSGTSLDGVDGVLVEWNRPDAALDMLAADHLPFNVDLRSELLALQVSSFDEVQRCAQAANQLVQVYSNCVSQLLKKTGIASEKIDAIGVHGQTVRHRPESGFTLQINNPALLAELTNIDVVADFRSRDIAAGGQGAPLVPAFHRHVFGSANETRVVANIGGISNISILCADGATRGFDTGPGNVLMDAWVMQHKSQKYDADGSWARQGKVNAALLAYLKDEPFFRMDPPKSTGRDLFNQNWLAKKLTCFTDVSPQDVQATLCAFTAHTLVDAIHTYVPGMQHVYICGGGAYNSALLDAIKTALNTSTLSSSVKVESTEVLGVSPNHVEALAFAWLAHRHIERLVGNLPEVTGAAGGRILGALYPR